MATITIAGTLYSDEGVTPITSLVTLAVSVNGAAAALTAVTLADGTYLTAGLTSSAGDVLTIYIQDGVNTQKAATVTKSTGSNMTGIDIYQDHLVLRSDNGAALTGTNVNTSDNNGATGISAIYSSASNTAFTVASGKSLLVASGQSVAFGVSSTVTMTSGNIVNNGTWTNGIIASTSGNLTNSGTWNSSTAIALTSGNLLNAGTWTTAGAITLSNGTLTNNSTWSAETGNINCKGFANAGNYTNTGSRSITVSGGNWSNSGTFTPNTGTVTLNGNGNQTVSGSTTFYNLTATGGDRSIIFTDGTTNGPTNALTLTGTAGHLLTIAGTGSAGYTLATPATQAVSYINISRCTATGNALAAGSTSTDGGNNVNVTFGSAPAPTAVVSDGKSR